MGLAKYAEDNWEIICDRFYMKGESVPPEPYFYQPAVKLSQKAENSRNKNSFAEMFAGESCFSFLREEDF